MSSINLNKDHGEWKASISEQLRLVEDMLGDAAMTSIESISQVYRSIISSGGKRIRPALVLLSFYACGGSKDSRRIVELAAAVELVHTASLLHDDVVDEAKQRRGQPTANSVWGNKISVLGGDLLVARAFTMLVKDMEKEITGILSSVSGVMAESQALEMECVGSLDMWKANYWKCIEGKTAAFMSACCQCGAVIAGAQQAELDAMREYGMHLGLAFQIVDDVLDVTGRQAAVGKDIGSDIRSGKFTLPLLLGAEIDPRIEGLLDDINDQNVAQILSIVQTCGAVEKARDIALGQIDLAIGSLDAVEDSEYRRSLVSLPRYVVDRDY